MGHQSKKKPKSSHSLLVNSSQLHGAEPLVKDIPLDLGNLLQVWCHRLFDIPGIREYRMAEWLFSE